jgi:hypothetical protein
MDKPNICVNFNSVFIEDQEVKRPKNFSVQAWLYFWNVVDAFDMEEFVRCREKLKTVNYEMEELQLTIDDLKQQLEMTND